MNGFILIFKTMGKYSGILVGVVTMLIGLAVWELFVKKMVVKNAYEAYYDHFDGYTEITA